MEDTAFQNICLELLEKFSRKVKILFVDDNQEILESIPNLFSSPLVCMHTASTSKQAMELITSSTEWHCWILDINLDEQNTGLMFLKEYPNFPFAVMLSGMRSMAMASKAMSLGAFRVFDKNPVMFESFTSEVCKIAALGYILSGKSSKYLSLFNILCNNKIVNAEEWAVAGCMTYRQLERVCLSHSLHTPRFLVPLYHTIEYLLSIDPLNFDDQPMPDENYVNDIHFIYKNCNKL